MAEVFDDASPGWMYETVYTDVESPLVFGGYFGTSSLPLFFPILYLLSISRDRDIRPKKTVLTITCLTDIYYDHWVAQVWNVKNPLS